MEFLICVSEAATAVSDDGLIAMLQEYRAENLKLNITGLLLYSQGVYLQAIEGELPDASRAYEHVIKDQRFKNTQLLASGEMTERMFKSWCMGFMPAEGTDMSGIKGYLDPTSKTKTARLVKRFYPSIRIIKDFLKEHFRY